MWYPDTERENWKPMCYTSNDGQLVNWEDSWFLAQAIEDIARRDLESESSIKPGWSRYLLEFVELSRHGRIQDLLSEELSFSRSDRRGSQ